MMNTTIPMLPVTALNAVLTDEYRQQVIRRALHACRKGSAPHVQRVKLALTKHIAIAGFQHDAARALQSPKFDLLCDVVIRAAESRAPLLEALLRAWVETWPDLKHAVRAELKRRGLPIDGIKKGLQIVPLEDQIVAVMGELIESFSSYCRDDVVLMAICVSGLLSVANLSSEHMLEDIDQHNEADESNEQVLEDIDQHNEADESLEGIPIYSPPDQAAGIANGCAPQREGVLMKWHDWLNDLLFSMWRDSSGSTCWRRSGRNCSGTWRQAVLRRPISIASTG